MGYSSEQRIEVVSGERDDWRSCYQGVNSFWHLSTLSLIMSILLIESMISPLFLFSSARLKELKATTHAVYLRL